MEKLTKIMLDGTEYPIKMDLNVLEYIQETYGSINKFEMDLIGLQYLIGEDGKILKDKEGKPCFKEKDPSIKAIKTALPFMINEGMEIEAEDTGSKIMPIKEKDIFRKCDIPYDDLAGIIHEEFKRCFKTKK